MLYYKKLNTKSSRKQEYRKKDFKNPYFKKKTVVISTRTVYSLIMFMITIFLWVYFLFSSSVFKITNIIVEGLGDDKKQLVTTEILNFFNRRRLLLFKGSNLFLLKSDHLKIHLLDAGIVIDDLSIEKKYPNKIIINIIDKNSAFIFFTKDGGLILSEDGTVIKREEGNKNAWQILETDKTTTSTENISFNDVDSFLKQINIDGNFPYAVFYDAYYLINPAPGEVHLAKNTIKNILDFSKNIYEKIGVTIKMVGFYKNNGNQKIILYTNNNWKIYINPEEDGLRQFYKFFSTFNDRIQDINKPLEYIDLRFGDRVYIK